MNLRDLNEQLEINFLFVKKDGYGRCNFQIGEQYYNLYGKFEIGLESAEINPDYIQHLGDYLTLDELKCTICELDVHKEEDCLKLMEFEYLEIIINKIFHKIEKGELEVENCEDEMFDNIDFNLKDPEYEFEEGAVEIADKIFNMTGNKTVTIVVKEGDDEYDAEVYEIEKDGKVGLVVGRGLQEELELQKDDVTLSIERTFLFEGSIIIKQSTNMEFEGTEMFRVYGVLVNNGEYKGLTKDEIKKVFVEEQKGNLFNDFK